MSKTAEIVLVVLVTIIAICVSQFYLSRVSKVNETILENSRKIERLQQLVDPNIYMWENFKDTDKIPIRKSVD